MPPGWVGVWVFYVISGYVITKSLMAEDGRDISTGEKLKGFFRRRAVRIIPIYYLYILACSALMLAAGNPDYILAVPYMLTFTYNWETIFQASGATGSMVFGHLWSLSVEEQFYLIYPLMFLFLSPQTYRAALLIIVLMGPATRYVYLTILAESGLPPERYSWAVYHSSIAQFDSFAMGALLANFEPGLRARARTYLPALNVAAGVALAYLLFCLAWPQPEETSIIKAVARNVYPGELIGGGRELFMYSAVNVISLAVLVACVLRLRMVRWLAAGPLQSLGRVSYGGYLYHGLILWLVDNYVMPVSFGDLEVAMRIPWFILVFALTAAVAYPSYHLIELPLVRGARERWQPRAEPVSQPAQ